MAPFGNVKNYNLRVFICRSSKTLCHIFSHYNIHEYYVFFVYKYFLLKLPIFEDNCDDTDDDDYNDCDGGGDIDARMPHNVAV